MSVDLIEQYAGHWFIFGELGDLVDVRSEPQGVDIVTRVKRAEAERLCKWHNGLVFAVDDVIDYETKKRVVGAMTRTASEPRPDEAAEGGQ